MSGGPVLVAIDFTADTLRLLLAQQDGTVVLRERWALPALADEDAWSWEVGGRMATLFAREGERRSALAIVAAAPGSVDPVTGRLLRSAGQPTWDGLAVVDALRRHINAPIAAESRTLAALAGEQWQGALAGVEHALYVSLRGEPTAALLIGGRPFRGATHEAGALPALPELDAGAPPSQQELSTIAGLLMGSFYPLIEMTRGYEIEMMPYAILIGLAFALSRSVARSGISPTYQKSSDTVK